MTETSRDTSEGWTKEECPDPAGIVRRGDAVRFKEYDDEYGEPPTCFVGWHPGESCERPAVMEVYGLVMCEVHGEEAASSAMEEIAYDLEQEFQRLMNPHVRPLGSHLERALCHGSESLPSEAKTWDHRRDAALLMAAFPFDRSRVRSGSLDYVGALDWDSMSPYDSYMADRLLLCRHMRLALEEGAHWLVEVLEREREEVAAQAAYAYVLDLDAGFRS